MSPERAIEYALAMEEPAPPTASGPRRTHTDELINVLTRREQEIAVRVTRRLTNSQIADALAISKHTVANHVATILGKLNLPSHSRIAVWIAQR